MQLLPTCWLMHSQSLGWHPCSQLPLILLIIMMLYAMEYLFSQFGSAVSWLCPFSASWSPLSWASSLGLWAAENIFDLVSALLSNNSNSVISTSFSSTTPDTRKKKIIPTKTRTVRFAVFRIFDVLLKEIELKDLHLKRDLAGRGYGSREERMDKEKIQSNQSTWLRVMCTMYFSMKCIHE